MNLTKVNSKTELVCSSLVIVFQGQDVTKNVSLNHETLLIICNILSCLLLDDSTTEEQREERTQTENHSQHHPQRNSYS